MSLSTHVEFSAEFIGRPGDNRDLVAHNIVHQYDGVVIGSGTLLPTSMRDLTIRVPRINANPLREALRKAGLTIYGEGNGATPF